MDFAEIHPLSQILFAGCSKIARLPARIPIPAGSKQVCMLEQRDLRRFWQIAKCSQCPQKIHMGLRHLGAGLAELLDGDKVLALAALHDIPGRTFAQTGYRNKGRQQLPILQIELGGVGFIDINGREF